MRRIVTALITAFLGVILAVGSSFAQQNTFEKQLVGTWTLVSTANTNGAGAKVEPFGPHPLGAYIFDASGHVIQVIVPSKEGTSNNVVATYGTYNVTDDGKSLVIHMIAAGKPTLDGRDSKRVIVSLTDDELQIHNLATTQPAGGGTAESVWKREK